MTLRAAMELAHSEVTDLIIGAAHHVYNRLGEGLFESVYQNALCVALRNRELEFETEKSFVVRYEGQVVGEYRADLVVNGQILIEAKAADSISKAHLAQTLNYLRISAIPVGLLINFGPRLQVRRLFR